MAGGGGEMGNKIKLIFKIFVLILIIILMLYLFKCSRPEQGGVPTNPPDHPQAYQDVSRSCPSDAFVADVVAIDHPMVFNRLGAQNVNWMMYALRHDVIDLSDPNHKKPLNYNSTGEARFLQARRHPESRDIALRPDLRPRPLVLRVPEGSCLKVRFTNLLHKKPLMPPSKGKDFPNQANPFESDKDNLKHIHHPLEHAANDISNNAIPNQEAEEENKRIFNIDDQVASRWVGFHPQGLEVVNKAEDTGANVGGNGGNGLLAPADGSGADDTKEYLFYAAKEGTYLVSNEGAAFGGEGTSGNSGVGLFGAVIVEPKDAHFYRGQVTEEEMRLVRTNTTDLGQPIIDYEAKFDCKNADIKDSGWCKDEEKDGLPVLNMVKGKRIIHGDINAIVVGSGSDADHPNDGHFPTTTYPLESQGKRNPAYPNRLEPFREFVSIFHDENAATQAFPYFFEHPILSHTLHGVRDAFMINYGSGGVGSEIIANRLKAGPMQDCIDCAYEEFFLSAFSVGDPAMLVDKPANLVTGHCQPEFIPKYIKDPDDPSGKHEILDPDYHNQEQFNKYCVQPQDQKAETVFYPHDPGNVHHSYMGDFVKFRNMHSGKEQHIFHLHNHQWLFNPNDDNSNYIDAQGIGPGSGYTYEIAYGGSGNRNKTSGDAIFHCHFYPHFAQGMWYLWRIHDVFESGTPLAVSDNTNKYHQKAYELHNGTPASNVRALPDGEIEKGTPIPAVVPLPGKALALMPAPVEVKAREGLDGKNYGSRAEVKANAEQPNPGYPFWVAGAASVSGKPVQSSIGSRPPTPPLDMSVLLDPNDASKTIVAGHDGGLPRHTLAGFSAGSKLDAVETRLDRLSAAKHIKSAMPVYYPEDGTELEKKAMAFHAIRHHASYKVDMDGSDTPAQFETNGAEPVPGAPYHDPCIDDKGKLLKSGEEEAEFFGGNTLDYMYKGAIEFGVDKPRVYKGANIQLDVVFNKVGYHYPQQRILSLWEDVPALLKKNNPKPPEPLVLRMNTYDCAMYAHTNLVPKEFYLDDYQITTPTDVIGQHIHLPKWDLTSADGSANGWNYEDGTFAPGEVLTRISAINNWNSDHATQAVMPPTGFNSPLAPKAHPYFGSLGGELQKSPEECLAIWNTNNHDEAFKLTGACNWFGARTTLQRWFSDPLVNSNNKHRGLGTTFTHDHLGPSTHQQLGLYATMLTEPPGSEWYQNETGDLLYDVSKRQDGGPTSWQAIITNHTATHKVEKRGAFTGYFSLNYLLNKPLEFFYDTLGTYEEHNQKVEFQMDIDEDDLDDSHREFFLQFGDFQHAYQKDKYVGVGKDGKQILPTSESFKYAIHPAVRKPSNPQFPDIFAYEPYCRFANIGNLLPDSAFVANDVKEAKDTNNDGQNDAMLRPCPEAISADDVGMMVVNYRNEPVGLRVYDEEKKQQAESFKGDLAFALSTLVDRKIKALNSINGNGNVPYTSLTNGLLGGDPFTPVLRANSGDLVKIKIQAGSHEHEHNSSINGTRWIQGGSGFGQAPHSGWRNAQNIGLSEQFTLTVPITDYFHPVHLNDRLYQIDTSQDGLWSGVWGIMRSATAIPTSIGNSKVPRCKMYAANSGTFGGTDLCSLPNNLKPTLLQLEDGTDFQHSCPKDAKVRHYEVTAVLANEILSNDLGTAIPSQNGLKSEGGTLVYNPRSTKLSIQFQDENGDKQTSEVGTGPLHDPTAILFVRTKDIDENTGKLKSDSSVEPIVLRAAAGECIELVLHNRLPDDRNKMPDLNGYTSLSGIVPHNLKTSEDSVPDLDNADSSLTTFNNNAIRPSNRIGLHPQLLHYNVQHADGNNIGINRMGTTPPGRSKIYHWYAGALNNDRETELNKSCPQTTQEETKLTESLEIEQEKASLQSISEFVMQEDFVAGITEILQQNRFSPEQIASLQAEIQPEITKSGCFGNEMIPANADKIADSVSIAPFHPDGAPLVSKQFDLFTQNGKPVLEAHLNCVRDLIGKVDVLMAADRTTPTGNFREAMIHKFVELQEGRGYLSPGEPDPIVQALKKLSNIPLNNNAAQNPFWIRNTVTLEESGLVPQISRVFRRMLKSNEIDCRFEDVEFGGTGLTPPDRIKQGQKGAVGALIVEPKNSDWQESRDDQVNDRQKPGNKRMTRATATVRYEVDGENATRTFRDIAFIHQKGLNFRYQNGDAVANLAAEKELANENTALTAPEDAHDSGHMAINYGSEPLWFRFGLPPDTPFGKEGFGGVHNAWQAFRNNCCTNGGTATSADNNVGEPYIPVYTAEAGQEMRIRTLMPTGVGRASTVELHGHHWLRDPYLAQKVEKTQHGAFPHGIAPHGSLFHDGGQDDWHMPAKCIGQNALAMTMSGQESVTPMAHFDMVFPRAGGIKGVAGDYLWRDRGGFGITNGLWGIVRVESVKTNDFAPNNLRLSCD